MLFMLLIAMMIVRGSDDAECGVRMRITGLTSYELSVHVTSGDVFIFRMIGWNLSEVERDHRI